MFNLLLLIFALGPQKEVKGLTSLDVPKADLQRLVDLKYYLCGLTPGNQREKREEWRGIGWFCVPEANCSGVETKYEFTEQTKTGLGCDSLRYNEGRTSCCFTGKLKPPIKFSNPKNPDWELYSYTGKTSKTHDFAKMEEYREALFRTFLTKGDSIIEETLKDHEICSVIPIGIDKGRTMWTPYICVTEKQCHETKNLDIEVDVKFPFGDRFCKRSLDYSDRPVCCHISSAIPEEKVHDSWRFIEFLTTQKYAPGFRSKFMCEQYNKLVCDGDKDRCTQKVLRREDYTLPGEFPHHALVRIRLPRRQTFHCQGSIISRLFVLTSYGCRQDDNTLANIVLVGTFVFDHHEETPVHEQITYIKNHISAHEKHWFLLLRLWRPLTLNSFIKPACIDWFSSNIDLGSQHFNFGQGWILGYGPLDPEGNFTTNVTRLIYNYASTKSIDRKDVEIECKARIPALKQQFFKGKFADTHDHICILGKSIYNPEIDKMKLDRSQLHGTHLGTFSQGASLSVFERYCQWKVYAIYIQNKKYYSFPPLLMETVPHAQAWIEEVVWRQDFDWLFFDLSWPACADWENRGTTPKWRGGKADEADYQFNFHSDDYQYMKPQHNDFFTS